MGKSGEERYQVRVGHACDIGRKKKRVRVGKSWKGRERAGKGGKGWERVGKSGKETCILFHYFQRIFPV